MASHDKKCVLDEGERILADSEGLKKALRVCEVLNGSCPQSLHVILHQFDPRTHSTPSQQNLDLYTALASQADIGTPYSCRPLSARLSGVDMIGSIPSHRTALALQSSSPV